MHDWNEDCPPPWSPNEDEEAAILEALEAARTRRYQIHFADEEPEQVPVNRR